MGGLITNAVVSDAVVTISPDGLSAYITVRKSGAPYPSAAQLMGVLHEKGVVFGIDDERVRRMVGFRIVDSRELVGHGSPAGVGTAGRLEFLVDMSQKGKPRLLQDGRVDHRDVQFVLNVKEGQALVRRVPAVQGVPGRTVFGEPIVPIPVPEAEFPSGSGTRVSSNDPHVLVAARDGALVIDEAGNLEVCSQNIIEGDIDYATGSIRCAGDVIITGSVRAGFSVVSVGSMVINGSIEAADIQCGGDLLVMGGASGGGKGKIRAEGAIRIKHVEHCTVDGGGDVTIAEDVVHSTVSAARHVYARTIVGGTTNAAVAIHAEEAGTATQTRTVLSISGVASLVQERSALHHTEEQIGEEIAALKNQLFLSVKDSMGPDGVLPDEEAKVVESLRTRCQTRHEELTLARASGQSLDKAIVDFPPTLIQVRRLHPAVIIKFGPYERRIDSQITDVVVTLDKDRLITTACR